MESEGSREFIFPGVGETGDAPLPNLTPRHQDLIPTPCGPIKPWSELSCPVKVYFCITLVSLLSIIGLTIKTLVQKSDENFTISLIQLIGVVFCIYYVTRGILQENRQELIVFILSILLVMFRSLVNFLVLTAEEKPAREDPVILGSSSLALQTSEDRQLTPSGGSPLPGNPSHIHLEEEGKGPAPRFVPSQEEAPVQGQRCAFSASVSLSGMKRWDWMTFEAPSGLDPEWTLTVLGSRRMAGLRPGASGSIFLDPFLEFCAPPPSCWLPGEGRAGQAPFALHSRAGAHSAWHGVGMD
ncbi:uncharacterized protein LOC103097840 isoform X4 [Monodelphis domestica]|uniref:uncharacterized protein LOC103097840 isoform X4 n=1 Tax=Monodelphis domestica TaxID=13616 RepID=UPI0024E1DA01|nr:uncharacterized protein LOC103097840 isoform X4 [Monodelphis domestica]